MSESSEPWNVLRLIQWTTEYFTRGKIDEPRLCTEILLAHVMGCPRLGLYTRFNEEVKAESLAAYRALVKKAAEHEPVAYLVGQREFYSLAMAVTPDVLIPRPETELLVDAALEFAKASGGSAKLWDVCTGSGCVAVAAAKYCPKLSALATDISAAALAVAKQNVSKHGLEGRIILAQADLLALPAAGEAMAPFDIITANPPYVADGDVPNLPAAVRREPDLALRAGPDGLAFIERLLADAPGRLRAGGLLAIEMGLGQADAVYERANAAGRYEDVRILKDSAGIARTFRARVKS